MSDLDTVPLSDADDGRDPARAAESVPVALWEAVHAHGELSGHDVRRL